MADHVLGLYADSLGNGFLDILRALSRGPDFHLPVAPHCEGGWWFHGGVSQEGCVIGRFQSLGSAFYTAFEVTGLANQLLRLLCRCNQITLVAIALKDRVRSR